MEKKVMVGVQIPKSLYIDLGNIAKSQYRSTAALVRMVLEEHVKEHKKWCGQVLRATKKQIL